MKRGVTDGLTVTQAVLLQTLPVPVPLGSSKARARDVLQMGTGPRHTPSCFPGRLHAAKLSPGG